ncbi:hypothetical protein Vafri_15126 [Volvox africanus]|nr:hypothetical protein Vafri_15126 [Volvox africanus]
MSELGAVNSLVSELLASDRTKANNAAKLLVLMSTCKQEAALKAAIQGLKQFFVAAGQDGLLTRYSTGIRLAKRQKIAPASDAAQEAAPGVGTGTQDDAEAQYLEWLRRQYGSFINQLLFFVTGVLQTAANGSTGTVPPPPPQRSAGMQVVAAAALMECVRSELGPGMFSGSLYDRLLSGVLLSPGVRPEVFALLFTKYLQLADVRFFTLATVKAVASKFSGSVGARAAASGGEAGKEDDEDAVSGATRAAAAAVTDAANANSSSSSTAVSLPDLVRNMYDVLCHVTETLPTDTQEWSTWCGAAEVNLVTAAADKNESSRLRRKRKEREEREKQQQQQQQNQQQDHDTQQQPQQRKVQWANTITQKRLYGDAWLALLALPLPVDVLRKALVRLPSAVIPYIMSPQLLADFLTHCLNRGGLTGMLALNGLFLLVTRHGLEYPEFFARLYQLLVPEAFVARTRIQFFRLADVFLSSSLVPAYTVAAFVKRFARLALGTSPAGAMIAIAFTHNLLRRHPALNVMLHKPNPSSGPNPSTVPSSNGAAASAALATQQSREGAKPIPSLSGPGVDPYDEMEADPAKSRAVESSLWEVEALRNHYCPQVSTFCAVLDKDLTDRTKTAEVNLEDLLGSGKGNGQQQGGAGSYNALIQGELARKLRKVPVAFYPQPPTALFPTTLAADEMAGWSL